MAPVVMEVNSSPGLGRHRVETGAQISPALIIEHKWKKNVGRIRRRTKGKG